MRGVILIGKLYRNAVDTVEGISGGGGGGGGGGGDDVVVALS